MTLVTLLKKRRIAVRCTRAFRRSALQSAQSKVSVVTARARTHSNLDPQPFQGIAWRPTPQEACRRCCYKSQDCWVSDSLIQRVCGDCITRFGVIPPPADLLEWLLSPESSWPGIDPCTAGASFDSPTRHVLRPRWCCMTEAHFDPLSL